MASLIANVHRSEGAPTFTPEMFMPGYEPKPQTLEEMSRALRELKATMDVKPDGQ